MAMELKVLGTSDTIVISGNNRTPKRGGGEEGDVSAWIQFHCRIVRNKKK